MRISIVSFLVGMLLMLPMNGFAATTIDFEGEITGQTVEGMGTIHPMMNIQSTPTGAIVIETFANPKVYGAPTPDNLSNACLEDSDGNRVDFAAYSEFGTIAKGFGYPQTGNFQDWSYDFIFEVGYMPASFGIKVFDVGDFNPTLATEHSVTLTAYDALNNIIDEDELFYTTAAVGNPTDSDPFGDLLNSSGDACTATFGEPGYFEMMVGSPTGISRIALTSEGQDPKVGFDSITIVDCTRTIGFWKNHTWAGAEIVYGVELIDELIGRSDPVDEKPGNGILWNAKGKNFSMLFAQWIAAKLNCDGGNCGLDLIDDVENFLLDNGVTVATFDDKYPDKNTKRAASVMLSALDDFNNGFSCYEEE